MNSNQPLVDEDFERISRQNEQQESWWDWAKRNTSQNISRAFETYVGLPGNVKSAFQQSVDYASSFLPESLKYTGEKEEVKPVQDRSVMELIFNPPTSQELREIASKNISEKLTGDKNYLEPRNASEAATGEFTQDLTSFFLPGTGKAKFLARLAPPVIGNLSKEGLKYLGASENTADKAKLGIMLATGVAAGSNPSKFASNRISQAKSMVPPNTTVFFQPLNQALNRLSNRLNRGVSVPSKSRARQGISDLQGQVDPQGRVKLHSLMDARDQINEWISEAGGWDVPTNTRDATIRNLNELKSAVIDAVDQNLSSRFPQAADLYRTGYEAAAVTHKSNAISNFIQNNFGKKFASAGAKILFPSVAGSSVFIPKTAAAVTASYPFYKIGQALYRISKSPTLARYYEDVLINAAKQNAPAMIKSLDKFDKAMKKEEKQLNSEATLEEFLDSF